MHQLYEELDHACVGRNLVDQTDPSSPGAFCAGIFQSTSGAAMAEQEVLPASGHCKEPDCYKLLAGYIPIVADY